VLGQGPNYLPVGLLTAPQLGHAGRPYPQPMITLLVTLPLPILNDPIEGPGYATSCSRPSLRQAWVPCRLRHPRFLTAEQPGPQRLTGLSPLKGRKGICVKEEFTEAQRRLACSAFTTSSSTSSFSYSPY
jgi:hypothetical protein